MKKIIIYAAALSFLSLASCKKEQTCTCTTTDTSSSGTVTTRTPVVTTYKKIKKNDAKDLCSSSSSENTYTQGSNTSTTKSSTKCELK
jgi:hypothetical protein